MTQTTTILAAPFRPFAQGDTYRTLAFLAASVPIGTVALGLAIAGWTGTAVLLVTPLVVPVLLAFRAAVGGAADAALARRLLGVEVRPRPSSGGSGYWGRAGAVVRDPAFWRQQVYLPIRTPSGSPPPSPSSR